MGLTSNAERSSALIYICEVVDATKIIAAANIDFIFKNINKKLILSFNISFVWYLKNYHLHYIFILNLKKFLLSEYIFKQNFGCGLAESDSRCNFLRHMWA